MPDGTAGLVLLVDDPDAPVQGSFVHWVLCNLDPARRGIAEGEPVSLTGRPSYQDIETAVTGHTLGEARLVGTYQR